MNNNPKRVLLIAGGGTLGTYTAKELLEQGHKVDIICLEDKVSDNENLTFVKASVDLNYLKEFLKDKTYDGIVNFIHYRNIEDYKPVHKLLINHTNHLIVLSSYRVYANKQIPVTEEAPMLLDVSEDKEFLETETYAIAKAKLEKYLNSECKNEPWTVVRPVISFSSLRFDLVTYYGQDLINLLKTGNEIPLPSYAKNLCAGLDWAGNSGKLIANLLFKKECFGEAYTVSSAQNLTWGEAAEIYASLLGAKFKWVGIEDFIRSVNATNYFALIYDRMFDRRIDNRKILKATGLTDADFTPIKEGLKIELAKIGIEYNNV